MPPMPYGYFTNSVNDFNVAAVLIEGHFNVSMRTDCFYLLVDTFLSEEQLRRPGSFVSKTGQKKQSVGRFVFFWFHQNL